MVFEGRDIDNLCGGHGYTHNVGTSYTSLAHPTSAALARIWGIRDAQLLVFLSCAIQGQSSTMPQAQPELKKVIYKLWFPKSVTQ